MALHQLEVKTALHQLKVKTALHQLRRTVLDLEMKQLRNISSFIANLSKEQQQELDDGYQNLETKLKAMVKREIPNKKALASRLAEKPMIIAHCSACTEKGRIDYHKPKPGAGIIKCVHLKTTETALTFWIGNVLNFATRLHYELMQDCKTCTINRIDINEFPVTNSFECSFDVSFLFGKRE